MVLMLNLKRRNSTRMAHWPAQSAQHFELEARFRNLQPKAATRSQLAPNYIVSDRGFCGFYFRSILFAILHFCFHFIFILFSFFASE